MSRQGKKNAKVKDTGRVKYIAVDRRTPLTGAKAARCVYPSRSAVSELPRPRHLSAAADAQSNARKETTRAPLSGNAA